MRHLCKMVISGTMHVFVGLVVISGTMHVFIGVVAVTYVHETVAGV